LLDSSTVSPTVPQTLAPIAAKKNLAFLDAPVSGGKLSLLQVFDSK